MDLCIERSRPLDECECVERREEMEVDTYTFITRNMGFAINPVAS